MAKKIFKVLHDLLIASVELIDDLKVSKQELTFQ